MIDEQLVFVHGGRCLRELVAVRDIRTPSVTSVIAAYMRSQGDDRIAELFLASIDGILAGTLPQDASEALAEMVIEYRAGDDDSEEIVADAAKYLATVTGIAGPAATVIQPTLTPLHRRLFDVMNRHVGRVSFSELREAWASDVQEETIVKTLKRLRSKLPRSQWDFEISEANWEIVWHKKGQAVP